MAAQEPVPFTGHGLTPRQEQVLDLIARGKTNPQIAEELGISLDGAKWHVSEVLSRLGVRSREEAAAYWRDRTSLRARIRRGVAVALAPGATRRRIGIAAAGAVAVVVVAILLVANRGDDMPAATPSETAVAGTPAPTTAARPEYLCPFDAPDVCDFAFETAAIFRPPSYGLSQLVAGSAWANPDFYPQLADVVETAFRFESADQVRPEDDGEIRLVSIGCPLHGDVARCEPGFVLTFADFDILGSSEGFTEANFVSLVFQAQGDGERPVLTGPLSGMNTPAIQSVFIGGQGSCNLLGLERRIEQCSGILFRSTLVPRPDGTSIAGLPVGDLVAADPVALPEGVTLYFNPTCYACEGGLSIFRAVNDGEGDVGITELSPLPSGSVRGAGPYHMAQAIDRTGQRMAVGVCDASYCGGVAGPEPGATATLWLSEDGGETWTDHGALPIWSSFHGFARSELMVQTWDYSTGSRTSWLYPSGNPWPAPPPTIPAGRAIQRWESPSGQVFWSHSADGAQWDLYDDTGTLIAGRVDPAYRTGLAAVAADGTLYFTAAPVEPVEVSLRYHLLALSPAGEPLAAYRWDWGDLRLTAPIAPGVFLGNALFGPYPEPPGAAVNFRPALIDFNAGTVSPIAGLPPDPASGIGGYAFVIAAIPAS